MKKMHLRLRARVWKILDVAELGDTASRIFDIFILSLIFLNVLAVIVGTVESLQRRFGLFFYWFEVLSVIVFTVEYLGRLWSCVTIPKFHAPIFGRIRYAFHPMPIIDLLAILPFYLPFLGFDLRFLRILRLFRVLRIAKIGRYYAGLQLIATVLRKKKEELVLTSALMLMLLILSASVIYYCEQGAQPEQFSSIPAALWWAVATLTTVGYGDIFPVTGLGKFADSFVAVLGIGMFALPTGILGAGFVEEIEKKKSQSRKCPHCGRDITE